MRQEGYYWVKHRGEFTIARYHKNIPNPWSLVGYTASFEDSDFDYINEVKIELK